MTTQALNRPVDVLSDRELLQLAAKAVGYEVARETDDCDGLLLIGVQEPWHPLDDDGEALRLATELRIDIRPRWQFVEVESGFGIDLVGCEDDADSRNAATRRAIVRAAAAIGAQS